MRKFTVAGITTEQVSLGSGYRGPETYRERLLVQTTDGALSLGVWGYEGELVSSNPGYAHQAWLVLQGTITVTMGDEALVAETGELVLFEAPYGAKTVEASADFQALWIAVTGPVPANGRDD